MDPGATVSDDLDGVKQPVLVKKENHDLFTCDEPDADINAINDAEFKRTTQFGRPL